MNYLKSILTMKLSLIETGAGFCVCSGMFYALSVLLFIQLNLVNFVIWCLVMTCTLMVISLGCTVWKLIQEIRKD